MQGKVCFGIVLGVFGVTSGLNAQSAGEDQVLKELQELLNTPVASASKMAEAMEETPVPVTVITAEMIELTGARNLKDLLITLVPGMTAIQDHNELVVGLRGVYTSSQQKILIMRDGHRLNSRAYSMANPDFSIDLASIKQIEVLRGPASSLYGNVSLTAVINIITKSGKEMEGTRAILGTGNFGQRSLAFQHGMHSGDKELVLWGSRYQSDGEARFIPSTEDYSRLPVGNTVYLERFNEKPSYDLGLKYRFGSATLLADRSYTKYAEPFSAGGVTGESYDINRYRAIYGEKPGLSSTSNHLGLFVNHTLGDNWNLAFHGYYDTNDIRVVMVTDPATGAFGAPGWDDTDVGFDADLSRDYELGGQKGTFLAGIQLDQMRVTDSVFPKGVGGEWTTYGDTEGRKVLEPGQETIYSAFFQVKHHLNRTLLFNGGARYDLKDRHDGGNISNLSPRLALVWMPRSDFELKLSYAKSFVDAPYWYRYNSLPSYRGGRDLKPERLDSIQVTPAFTFLEGRLKTNLNLFYNHLTDFVFRNNNALPTEPIYTNAGSLKNWGAEWEGAYVGAALRLRANATYQRAVDFKDYGVRDGHIFNVPNLSGSAVLDLNLGHPWERKIWLDITYRYVGSQLSPIDIRHPANTGSVPSPAVTYSFPDNSVRAAQIINVGLRWNAISRFLTFVDLRTYNATDTDYKQGGSVLFPYPQQGRSWLLKVGFSLDALLAK